MSNKKPILVQLMDQFESSLEKTASLERKEYDREAHILRVSASGYVNNIVSQFPKNRKLSSDKLKKLTKLAKEACRAIHKEVVDRQKSAKYNSYTYKILSATSVSESNSRDTFRVFIVSNTGRGRPFNQANDIKKKAETQLAKNVENEFNIKVKFDLGHDYSVAEHVRDEILVKFSTLATTASGLGMSISDTVGYSSLIKMSSKAIAKKNLGKTFIISLVEEYPDLKDLVSKGVLKPEDGILISAAAEDFKKNRSKGATKETKALSRVKTLGNNILPRIDFLRGTGSPSRLDLIYSEIAKTVKKHGGKTKTKIVTDTNSSLPAKKVKGNEVNIKVTSKVTSESVSVLPKLNVTNTSPDKDWSSLINILNLKLTEKVIDNMVRPRLVNRTGTFANSVKVIGMTETKDGYPSIVYDYQRDPYNVFDRFAGSAPWNTPARDPRALIELSIREIMRELAIGRFYTRRA